MEKRVSLRFNPQRHRENLILQMFERCANGRTMSEFIKDILQELAISDLKGEAPVLLALNSQIVMEQKATKKAKKVKSAPEITEASKRDVHGDTAANEKASTETETAISDDAILKTGFS